jgi:hypothetical protein
LNGIFFQKTWMLVMSRFEIEKFVQFSWTHNV